MRTPGTPHARAGLIYIDRVNQRCLLGYRENNGHTYFTVPGGGIESGETPEQTAQREFTEETGLTALGIRHLASYPNPLDPALNEHLFISESVAGSFNPDSDPDRNLPKPPGQVWEMRFVPISELASTPLLPDNAKAALLTHLGVTT